MGTCGGVRPDWMAAAHKSLAKAMSCMEEEKGNAKTDHGMAEVFDSSGVYVKWFGSSVPTSVSATTVFQRFYRDGNISLEFKAENVVASTSKATGDTPILCEETGI